MTKENPTHSEIPTSNATLRFALTNENRDYIRLPTPHAMLYMPFMINETRYDSRFDTKERPLYTP